MAKSVDQNGVPFLMPSEYRGNNIPWGGALVSQIKTDANGEFRITSTRISLYVNVSKENYSSLLRRSDIPPGEPTGALYHPGFIPLCETIW